MIGADIEPTGVVSHDDDFLSSAEAGGETAEPRTSSNAAATRTVLPTQLMNSPLRSTDSWGKPPGSSLRLIPR